MSQNHGWASPAPAGLVALAVACFTFFGVLSGKVDHSCIPLLGCWLLGGFVIQIIVGIIELMEGNTTGGNVFTFFAAFFMLVGGLEFFVKFAAHIQAWQIDTRIDGWAWSALAIALLLWTPAYFKAPLLLTCAVLALDVAVPIVALMDLNIVSHAWAPIAAYSLLIAGILALYISSAIVLNAAYGRALLPMPGLLVTDKAAFPASPAAGTPAPSMHVPLQDSRNIAQAS
jgi:succinate-acetate transporter protein